MSAKEAFFLSIVAASSLCVFVIRYWWPSTLDSLNNLLQNRRLWIPLCAVFLASFLGLLALNTTYVGYLEHVEPHIASVAFNLLRGAPLYHDLDSAQRYSFAYGPIAYVPYLVALRVIGANVLSLKLVVFSANLALLALLWNCYRRVLAAPAALLMLVVVVVFMLLSGDYLFQVRGDILTVLAVALGLFAALSPSARISGAVFAAACGLSVDIKFTSIFYFLPLYILLIRRHGWHLAVLASLGAAIFAVMPFLSPAISFVRYLEWLRLVSRHPTAGVQITGEVKMLLLVCTPIGLLVWQLLQRSRGHVATYLQNNRFLLVTLVCCVAAVAFPAATIGAGAHHFLPFLPIAGYVCAEMYRSIDTSHIRASTRPHSVFIPLLWFWLAVAVSLQVWSGFGQSARTLLTSRSLAVAVTRDLGAIMKNHPRRTIEMGYGDLKWYGDPGYTRTYFRPALVFAGNPVTIDAMALDDMQLSGVGIPLSTLEYLRDCKTQIWLIPKGDPPFALPNLFSLIDRRLFPVRPLFDAAFRQVFFQRYRKSGSSQFFDIWECEMEPREPDRTKGARVSGGLREPGEHGS